MNGAPKEKGKALAQDLQQVASDYRGRILPMIERRLRDQAEAEDVWQDVLIELIETYDVGRAIESLSGWLVRVAQNKIVDRFRRRKTQNDYRETNFGRGEDFDVDTNSPEAETINRLLREELMQALAELPDEQRQVFVMHELEGKSFEDIAKETGVGVNTLLSRKRYAILFLRNYLKEVYDELE